MIRPTYRNIGHFCPGATKATVELAKARGLLPGSQLHGDDILVIRCFMALPRSISNQQEKVICDRIRTAVRNSELAPATVMGVLGEESHRPHLAVNSSELDMALPQNAVVTRIPVGRWWDELQVRGIVDINPDFPQQEELMAVS